MGSSDEEYVEEYYRVRRRKDTHLADSSNDPDAKRAMLFDDDNDLVTHAELYAVDEDELREQYSTHDIEYVYVEEERDEVKEAVAFAIAEVVVYVAKDVWDKHGDEIIAWVGDKAGRAAGVVKR